jgi:hypothetical protein
MAGKTLSGIGEDESGKHELGADESDPSIKVVKPPSTRATDRMPMSTMIGIMPIVEPPLEPPPYVDEDKVAEGLKRLRSLDEPLGPIPSSMPTLKEGIPVVGTPTPVNPAAIATATAVELLRSRGTAHGHALSAAAGGQGTLPVSVDDRMKGTLLGHSLHLPDLPEVVEENRPAEVRSIARVAPAGSLTPGEMNTDFSHGDARFFDSEPVNNEYEPEKHVRSHKVMVRGLTVGAVASILVVAAIAWTRSHKAESPVVAPAPEVAAPAPAAPDNAPAPATPHADQPAAAAVAAPAAAPDNSAAPPAPAEATPPAAAAPTARAAHTKHEAAAATPRSSSTHSSSSASHAARPGEPARAITKPAVPGKRAKIQDDPDGTLPLDE